MGYVICFIVGVVIGTLAGVCLMCLFSLKRDDYTASTRKETSDTDDKDNEVSKGNKF